MPSLIYCICLHNLLVRRENINHKLHWLWSDEDKSLWHIKSTIVHRKTDNRTDRLWTKSDVILYHDTTVVLSNPVILAHVQAQQCYIDCIWTVVKRTHTCLCLLVRTKRNHTRSLSSGSAPASRRMTTVLVLVLVEFINSGNTHTIWPVPLLLVPHCKSAGIFTSPRHHAKEYCVQLTPDILRGILFWK